MGPERNRPFDNRKLSSRRAVMRRPDIDALQSKVEIRGSRFGRDTHVAVDEIGVSLRTNRYRAVGHVTRVCSSALRRYHRGPQPYWRNSWLDPTWNMHRDTMWAEPNDDVIPHLDCPLCHNDDRRFIVGTWEDPIGVARCTACGLVHTTGRHASEAVTPSLAIDGATRRQHRQAFDLYDRLLEGRLRTPAQGATALDIGCDGGAWLDQLRLWGYRTEGTDTEPKPGAADHRVYEVDADGGADLGRQYDVVSLIDRLHLAERPAATLHFAARHLAPGGVVIIEVPNWNHKRARSVFPDGIELGGQVAFYDRDSLRDAVTAVGLQQLAVWSAPGVLDRAMAKTRAHRDRRAASSFLRRTLSLAERALAHASDASDQGAKLVMVAHRPMDNAH